MNTSLSPHDNDEHQPSTSGASAAHSLDLLKTMDLRDLCEQIFVLLRIIEDEGQENVEQASRSRGRPFWQMLSCLPILQELLKGEKPNHSVLKPYFIKGENDANTLADMILRDVRSEVKTAVALLSVGASLENGANINQHMRDVCLSIFQQMCEVGKLLYDLRSPMTGKLNLKQKLQKELQKGTELLVEGSIICAFHVHGAYLSRYLQGCSCKESLTWFLSKMEYVHKTLCSWSESFIFEGVRASPLSGRPHMNYPHHAVGIEREKQDIIKMLEWGNQRKTVAVIVSGEAGIGKTTVADAVFTSIHIPLCNYTRYTCFDSGFATPVNSVYFQERVKCENWVRYKLNNIEDDADSGDDNGGADDGNAEAYEESEDNGGADDGNAEAYEESEAAGDTEEEDEVQQLIKEDDYNLHHANDLVDLLLLESKLDAALHPCTFIYFDNPTDTDPLSDDLKRILENDETRKQRIIVTTRDVEYAWKECKEVLSEDCMYNYVMLAAAEDKTIKQLSKEKEIATKRSRKTMKELKEIARSSMGHRAWQMMLQEAATATAADQDNPSSTSFHSHYHAHDDDDDVPEMVKNIIKFCKGIPERLLVIAKYIAAAAAQQCSPSALQQLLNVSCDEDDDDDIKWQKIINLFVKQDFLAQEYMDALQLLCYFRYYCFCSWEHLDYPVWMSELASWESLACLTKDVVEEHTLNILQEKGMLVPDGRGGLRIPFPLWRYFIITNLNKNCISVNAYNDEEFGGLQEALTQRAAAQQQDDERIKALVLKTGEYANERYMVLLPQEVAKNLQVMWAPNVIVSGVMDEIMDKLIVHAGWSRSNLAIHMAPSIRHMILRLEGQDCHKVNWQQIPQGLRYLQLEAISDSTQVSGCAWESIARLSNLRALTLLFHRADVEMKVPAEFCSAAAVSNNIRELYIECRALEELPHNFGQLRCLHILRLEGAKLRRLPQGFGMLSSLRELSFDSCTDMEELCSDFSNLGSLHSMCWVYNHVLPEKCWKEMVKLKRLTTLLLDSDLCDESKTLPFPPRVHIYYRVEDL